MRDYVVRAIAADATVRAFGASTLSTVQEAMNIHHLTPAAATALGRSLTATAMMTKMLQNEDDKMTIQIKGNGPINGIVAVSDSRDSVRGYVGNPNVPMFKKSNGKIDVSKVTGEEGYVNVVRDIGLKEPYVGYVDLVSGEIADDLAAYYVTSEQIPTVFSLGEYFGPDGNFQTAGGYIIQLMPGASEETLSIIENKVMTYPTVSELMSGGDAIEDILKMILGTLDMRVVDKSPIEYKCNCSRFRMETNILALGKNEIMDIIEDQDVVETQCHFCNKKYEFDKDDLLQLLKGQLN